MLWFDFKSGLAAILRADVDASFDLGTDASHMERRWAYVDVALARIAGIHVLHEPIQLCHAFRVALPVATNDGSARHEDVRGQGQKGLVRQSRCGQTSYRIWHSESYWRASARCGLRHWVPRCKTKQTNTPNEQSDIAEMCPNPRGSGKLSRSLSGCLSLSRTHSPPGRHAVVKRAEQLNFVELSYNPKP